MTCSLSKNDRAEFAFGEGGGEVSRLMAEHLATCPACATEVAEYKELLSVSRAAFPAQGSLPSAVVARISRRAAEEAVKAGWWRRLLPVPSTPVLAAVVPAVVAVLALGVVLAVRSGHPGESAARSEVPARLDMQVEGSAVRLAWTDGRGKAYKVYKTSDPRLLGRGTGTVVQGNQWLDQEPDSSPIVFYRVE